MYSCRQVLCTLVGRYFVLLSAGIFYSCREVLSTLVGRYFVLLSGGTFYSCRQVLCTLVGRYFLLLSAGTFYSCRQVLSTLVGRYFLLLWVIIECRDVQLMMVQVQLYPSRKCVWCLVTYCNVYIIYKPHCIFQY